MAGKTQRETSTADSILFDTVENLMAAKDDQKQRWQKLCLWLTRGTAPPDLSEEEPVDQELSGLLRERQQARRRAREQTAERLNHLFNSLFTWNVAANQFAAALDRELALLEEADRRALSNVDLSLEEALRFEVRTILTAEEAEGQPLVESLRHQIGFFEPRPVDVGFWAKFFLDVERYHRLKGVTDQERDSMLSQVRRRLQLGGTLRSLQEFILYLDAVLDEAGSKPELETLAADLTEQLQGHLAENLFPDVNLYAAVTLSLLSLQYCRAETVPTDHSRRLLELKAGRRLHTVEDLMLLVYDGILKEPWLPRAAAVLDALQEQGFPIEHRDFRDSYRAQLVPLELSRQAADKRLCLFVPLESLTGELHQDLQSSRRQLLQELHNIRLQLHREASLFYQCPDQPLVRSDLLRAAGAFSVSWELAGRLARGGAAAVQETEPEALAAAALELVPRPALKLIRPRKGYEFKSRQAFKFYLDGTARSMLGSLREALASGRVTSSYHGGIILRLGLLAPLASDSPPGECPPESCLKALKEADPEKTLETLAAELRLDLSEAAPLSAARLNRLAAEALPLETICNRASRRLSSRPDAKLLQDSKTHLNALIAEMAPVLYRLAVAEARRDAGLPRLPASISRLTPLVQLLAPTLPHLEATALEEARARTRDQGIQVLGSSYRPFVETPEELGAVAKYRLAQILQGSSLEAYAGQHDLEGLEALLREALAGYQISPGILEEDLSEFLLGVVQPQDEAGAEKRALAVNELLQLLPKSNCAACGQPSCQDFARALLGSRVPPEDCRQLEPAALSRLEGRVRELGAGALPPAPGELSDQERALLEPLLKVEDILTRLKVMQAHENHYRQQAARLPLFRRPDPDIFYEQLVRHLGFEAVERLRPSERRHLEHHGEVRTRAAWQAWREAADWFKIEIRRRQSGASQLRHDPLEVSREFYADKLFLSQLSSKDRRRVLRHRLDTCMEDFAQWWNGDLLEMSDPDYQIQDWDDFTKIIKNAYWHHEYTPIAGDIIARLQEELEQESSFREMTEQYLNDFVLGLAGQEFQRAKKRRRLLADTLAAGRIYSRDQLDLVLSHFVQSLPRALRHGPQANAPRVVSSAFDLFNRANLEISADLRFYWEELDEEIQSYLGYDSRVDQEELLRFRSLPGGMSWLQMQTLRAALIRGLLDATWRRARQELMEARVVTSLFTAKPESSPPAAADDSQNLRLLPGMVRCYLRQRFKDGDASLPSVRSELERRLQRHPHLAAQLREEALSLLVRRRLSLAMEHGSSRLQPEPDPGIPALTSWVDGEIQSRMRIDRERLLHSLFLLAKMEGNLEGLTALLRGIRETADIIEAAWLQFTQERAALAPLPRTPAGVIPLRAALLKNKDKVNDYLRQGVPRGEKKETAQAIQELLTHIRFHILQQDAENLEPENILSEMQARGYLLEGIDPEALLEAIRDQISRKSQYQKDRIWIYTTVCAHNLAAAHPALVESEQAFHQRRSRILNPEGEPEAHELGEICGQRGVELAKIKEETYHQLSELLEKERIDSFQKRIRQIIAQLDRKRAEIGNGWRAGLINRRTVFYLLRRLQKDTAAPAWTDYLEFLREHWRLPLESLARSARPDEAELRERLKTRVENVLGLDLDALEAEAQQTAREEMEAALEQRLQTLERLFFKEDRGCNLSGGGNDHH